MAPPDIDDNQTTLTRRQLLLAAGGVTFLGLFPAAEGAFAARQDNAAGGIPKAIPLFTALPYLQPGSASKLVEGGESIVIAWQTNGVAAEYRLDYGAKGQKDQHAALTQNQRWSGDKADGEQRINHAAALTGLDLGKKYQYRLSMNGASVLEGFFTTRKPRGEKVRFVSFGDNSFGEVSDRAIAYQAFLAHPDFVMNTGDNVYENGLDNEYAGYFFPVYNADQAGPRIGAPLLRSVPFYTVIANHDVHAKDADKHPVADFHLYPDSLAYFTNMHMPGNGPVPTVKTPIVGPEDVLKRFADCAGERFPNMANYSFDYGEGHFLCLDSNVYVDPTDPKLQGWIEQDLAGTDARWKFVVYHHPAFNVGDDHYAEQHMRALSPLFEKHGVAVVLHGHEHTYQRTRPIRFAPSDLAGAKKVGGKSRLVPGEFTVDRAFDGEKVTKPEGVLYLTTGAGGKHLYDPESNNNPAKWLHPEDKNIDYVVRFVSDRHSLTTCEMDRDSLTFTQIDGWGNRIDRFRITA